MANSVTTPVLCCGFECRVNVGATSSVSHFGTQTAANLSYDTSVFNSAGGGAASLLIDNTGTATAANLAHNLASGIRVVVARFYVRLATDTSGTASLFQGTHVTNTMVLQWRTGRKLRIALGATTSVDSAALNLNQWYRIDVLFKADTGTLSGQYWIDGVSQTGATVAQAAADITAVTVGNTATNTYKCYVDDLVVSTTEADAPIGDGGVVGYVPTSVGTHSFTAGDFQDEASSNITIGETASHAKVDELPPTNSDFIKQVVIRAAGYVEYVYPTPARVPRAVEHVVYVHNVGTQANTQKAQLYDGTGASDSYTAVSTGSVAGTVRSLRGHFATAPSGGAWTTGKFENLRMRWGFAGDVTHNPALDSTIIEAEFGPLVTGTGAIAANAPAVAATGAEIFTGTGAIAGQAPTIAGSGTHTSTGVTGTGAITSPAPAVVGSGAEIFTGTGAMTMGAPSVTGAGAEVFTGSGAIAGSAPTTTGTGWHQILGTGAIAAPSFSVAGSGIESMEGTGVLSAPSVSLSASGWASAIGAGAISAPSPTVAGTGAEAFTGTGAIASPAAQIVGEGWGEITGSGVLIVQPPQVVGFSTLGIAGTGAITGAAPGVSGFGAETFSGTGALEAPSVVINGLGQEVFTATGAISAPAPTLAGSAAEVFAATGDALAPAPIVEGTGTVVLTIIGTGEITAPRVLMAGAGAELLTGTGAISAQPPTLLADGLMTIPGTVALSESGPSLTLGVGAQSSVVIGSSAGSVDLS